MRQRTLETAGGAVRLGVCRTLTIAVPTAPAQATIEDAGVSIWSIAACTASSVEAHVATCAGQAELAVRIGRASTVQGWAHQIVPQPPQLVLLSLKVKEVGGISAASTGPRCSCSCRM